jgi:hypothetical protein
LTKRQGSVDNLFTEPLITIYGDNWVVIRE